MRAAAGIGRSRRRGAPESSKAAGASGRGGKDPIRFSRIQIARCAAVSRFSASVAGSFPSSSGHHVCRGTARADRPPWRWERP
ncbi:hypothetical protein MBT84_41070 [Streptomyces sp. MBT84]|nr:hypothetical protein [Streptomyces sp. MBT84]